MTGDLNCKSSFGGFGASSHVNIVPLLNNADVALERNKQLQVFHLYTTRYMVITKILLTTSQEFARHCLANLRVVDMQELRNGSTSGIHQRAGCIRSPHTSIDAYSAIGKDRACPRRAERGIRSYAETPYGAGLSEGRSGPSPAPENTPGWFHPGPLRKRVWCGRRELNPHGLAACGFSYHFGFRRPASAGSWSGLYLHHSPHEV